MLCSLAITIAGIYFEVNIHVVLAPLALSTLVNDTTRSTGISFIKSYAATCLQLTIIGVCTTAFIYLRDGIFTPALNAAMSVLTLIMPEFANFINVMLTLLMFVCFITAVKKSGDLTKRMFGA
jgi:hypothetical protein